MPAPGDDIKPAALLFADFFLQNHLDGLFVKKMARKKGREIFVMKVCVMVCIVVSWCV